MILDLSAVVNAEGKKLAFDTKLDFQDAKDLGIDFSQPVEVSGNVVNIGGSLELSANVRTVLRCVCNRCCVEFCEDFECSFEEVLKKEDKFASETEDLDAVYFQGNQVELDEIVLNNIIVAMPIKMLCKEDCRGLCPVCGKNLNDGDCGCDTRTSDPRFDVLDKFFE